MKRHDGGFFKGLESDEELRRRQTGGDGEEEAEKRRQRGGDGEEEADRRRMDVEGGDETWNNVHLLVSSLLLLL